MWKHIGAVAHIHAAKKRARIRTRARIVTLRRQGRKKTRGPALVQEDAGVA